MSITTTCIGACPKPDYIDAQRLLAAPDCGLMMLGRELTMAKLKNMCAAAAVI